MLSSLFLNNPFEKQTSPLKQSYWENRRREEQAHPQQALSEPTTPAFSQALSSPLTPLAEDTFSLTPLPLFESEPPFPLSESAESLAFSLPAETFPSDFQEGEAPAQAEAGPWLQPFLADVFGESTQEDPLRRDPSQASTSRAQALPSKHKTPVRQGAVRNQPRRQAKGEPALDSLPSGLYRDLASQRLLLGGALEGPLSPRAADTKAGNSKRQPSRFTISQESGSLAAHPYPSQSSLTSDAIRADVMALIKGNLSPSEPAPAEPLNKRAELKIKKERMLQDYASGQTDGPTLLTTYHLTPKQLRTWVLAFRRQQEANGVHHPKLSWPRHRETPLAKCDGEALGSARETQRSTEQPTEQPTERLAVAKRSRTHSR